MRKITLRISLISAVIYLISATMLLFQQGSYIYFPTPKVTNINEQKIAIQNGKIKLNGWVINQNKQNAIIYFGGNNEQISENIKDFKTTFPNHTIYLINYRGYGGNKGKPSEKNFYNDSLKIYDTISKKHKTISVIGRSLGTGTATYLAVNRKIEKLVLTTPFDSITSMAQDKYPFFPISLMLKNKFDSKSRATNITAKILVFIAETDKTVPHKYTKELVKSLPKNLTTVINIKENSDHSNISHKESYKKAINSWFYSDLT